MGNEIHKKYNIFEVIVLIALYSYFSFISNYIFTILTPSICFNKK